MRRGLAVLLVCATAGTAGAGASPPPKPLGPREAEPPIIELLTFGVGDRIFERYGHAAICLRYHDPRNPPVCFNYGVTSFGDGPILIWRFLRGEQRFWVERLNPAGIGGESAPKQLCLLLGNIHLMIM